MIVVYSSNDSYARHLGTSMCSLFDRNKNCPSITVYILSLSLSGENLNRLEKIAGQYGRKLIFVEMGDLKDRFHFQADTGGYDISIMGRLFMGEVLPDSVEKVLYLDCDTVVVQPLRQLWNTDLEGNIMGAVMEPTIYETVKDSIGIGREQPYFNSGVLLVDLRQWREKQVQKRLLEFWQEKGGKLFASDQDLLNGTLKGEIKSLSPRYNFFTNYRYFSYEDLIGHSPSYMAVTREMFAAAKRHPAIIHYMGDERPWVRGNLNHYRRAYEIYLAQTPWAGTPKEKGKELYMAAYHGLDYVTAVCPRIRWAISRKLGMKMVEARAERKGKKVRNDMKITILMAAYEGERYIEQQLDSILAQTIPNLQILVSDDGSKDRTREILEKYEKWYPDQVVLRHRIKEGEYQDRENKVPPMAMNFFWLLSKAQGDYILFSDQDDVWENHKVRALLGRMKALERRFGKEHPILVHSDMEVTDEDLNVISRSFFRYQRCNPNRTAFSEVLAENPVTGGAAMINRALAELVDRVPGRCFMHDWWIALAASCFGTISCVKEPLYQYRQHTDNALGANQTGSLEDMRRRAGRQSEVEDNYRRMFAQAASFGAMYKDRMTREQKQTLKAFLALPLQPPGERFRNIVRNRFYKSSPVQTLAQCVTIPELSRKRRPD